MTVESKYSRGDVIKVRITSENPEHEVWVEAFVELSNSEDKSYNVQIPDHLNLGVDERMHNIQESIMRPLFLTKDVEFLLAEGYNREEVFQSLDNANGDLDDALLFLHRYDRLRSTTCEGERLRSTTCEGESEKESSAHQRSSELSHLQNATSQPSSSSSSFIKEFAPSRKQIEQSNRPPSIATPLMNVPEVSACYRKTSFFDDVKAKRKITIRPRDDEFDYTVVFEKVPLGFEIHPAANNRNACIGKTLNRFSQENVYKGSLILDCNDVWLLGQSSVYIQQCIKAECQMTPVTITFRAKKWMTSERARNLRKHLESSRTKRAKSFSHMKKKSVAKRRGRAKTENFLSPRTCTRSPDRPSPKVVRTRLPPSERKKLKRMKISPELRLFILGGQTEFGVTHVEANITNMKSLITKKYRPNRMSCFAESLIWENFKQESETSLTVKAMSEEKVVGIGSISIPILPCTINHSVDLLDKYGSTVGVLNVRVTHIR